MIGMEGGHSIDNSLATLRQLYAPGARYMTLTHSQNVPLGGFGHRQAQTERPLEVRRGSGPGDEPSRNARGPGHTLTRHDEGRARDCRGTGHLLPLVGAGLCNVPRNVPDDVLQLLPKNGGVVMVTFVPGFVSQAVADWNQLETAQQESLRGQFPGNTAYVNAGWSGGEQSTRRRGPRSSRSPITSTTSARSPVSITSGSAATSTASPSRAGARGRLEVPDLTAELLKRGYKDEDVKKILGLNVLRAWRQAEQAAARLQKMRGPSTATIEALDK